MGYRTTPKAEYYDGFDAEKYMSRKVFDSEEEWIGLYDAEERKIYRVMDPVGFIRRRGDDRND